MSKYEYEVIVGNVGSVYIGNKLDDARHVYAHYVDISQSGMGRAAGEWVTIFKCGEPFLKYNPPTVEM